MTFEEHRAHARCERGRFVRTSTHFGHCSGCGWVWDYWHGWTPRPHGMAFARLPVEDFIMCEYAEQSKNVNPRAQLKQAVERLGGATGGIGPSNQCASEAYGNGRQLLDRLIDYHNRQARFLHAVLRGIPQEMTPEAERGLYELAKAALGNIR